MGHAPLSVSVRICGNAIAATHISIFSFFIFYEEQKSHKNALFDNRAFKGTAVLLHIHQHSAQKIDALSLKTCGANRSFEG